MELDFGQGKVVYIVDTSALIMLESTFKYDNPVFKAIWEEIEDLIRQGCFKTIDFVNEEIDSYEGKQDFLKKWVKKWKKHFVIETDANSINAAIPIINDEYKSGFLTQKSKLKEKRRLILT